MKEDAKINAVNLGCGTTYRTGWTNLDMKSPSPDVCECNFLSGLPLPDNSVEFVYHSHVLEHLDAEAGQALIAECFRILKPSGTLRVVVPDLEQIARAYLSEVDADDPCPSRIDWMQVELCDQLSRESPRGRFKEFIDAADSELKTFVLTRLGTIASDDRPPSSTSGAFSQPPVPLLNRIRKKAARLLLTESENDALAIGEFRLGGEPHKAMYDRHLLANLLNHRGFVSAEVVNANLSRWSLWEDENLDISASGKTLHANSLYMEATKPLSPPKA